MLFLSSVIVYIYMIGFCTATSQGQCKATEWFKPKTCTEKTLPKGDAFKVFSTEQKLKCMKVCNKTAGNCLSVSYDRRNKLCYQFDDIGDNCTDMVVEPDTQYYYKDIECLNGGDKMSATQCNCSDGFLGRNCNRMVSGCPEVYDSGVRGRNKVLIQPAPNGPPISVYCDDRDLIVMRHYKNHPSSFNRTWDEYVNGFMEDEYRVWIGLETLYQITTYIPQQVLSFTVGMQANPTTSWNYYADYTDFKVGDRSTHYTITYSSYIPLGTSGDLGDVLNGLNGSSFSTYDRDNDGVGNINCALQYAGGWWFNGLNGCSTNSITSFFTCPSQNCDPMAIKKFPNHARLYEYEKISRVSLYLKTEQENT
ncbi:hypothetical protein SNE40_008483 [Patella caerulea]|uniref:Fibrinogen C-terminal domain-containing protein n=1 Tax=Patella caerulea TaxID=87958 RepID=A0AAN8K066_PATCE